ncbi:MAG: LysM peptidoglycan-binding domain-containing protein [Candidatus Villigracilaceae bacterium]
MKHKTFYLFVIFTILLALSGCRMPYSAVPEATPTEIIINEELFPPALPATEDPMAMIGSLATASAMAMMQTAETESAMQPAEQIKTPMSGEFVITVAVDSNMNQPTSTLPVLITLAPTMSANLPAVSTPVPGSLPYTYTLRGGEFPYCIARRFNVNPDELLTINNLADGTIYMPGLTLKIPQSGNPFPANRALRPHPATYTTTSSGETFYSIACLYGDVDPTAIAAANRMSPESTLQVGTTIRIP